MARRSTVAAVETGHVVLSMSEDVINTKDCTLTNLVLLSYLDRSNIGNARIAGMEDDLSLTGDRYDWLLTIFYISYIIFQFQVGNILTPT